MYVYYEEDASYSLDVQYPNTFIILREVRPLIRVHSVQIETVIDLFNDIINA